MLHILMSSPFRYDVSAMLRLLSVGDDVLLMQDGVIAALNSTLVLEALLSTSIFLYALQEDINARGLFTQISTKLTVVSYADFLALVLKNSQQIVW